MVKILIFGNSGAGKSTLAKKLAVSKNLAHLDLDTLAWQPIPAGSTAPPGRLPLKQSRQQIDIFTNANPHWIIEGCYTDLLEMLSDEADEIIFMDLDVNLCIANAANRPWEPHKYPSKTAQDKNLPMLTQWIQQYTERDDGFSHQAHQGFYEAFKGNKSMVRDNQ
ncbi:MAG: adenylate kinase family enzyme [Alteromonadaceae bacterium]|jgi:adenylate kinase family enzyme